MLMIIRPDCLMLFVRYELSTNLVEGAKLFTKPNATVTIQKCLFNMQLQ